MISIRSRTVRIVVLVVACYLVVRGVAEFFVIDLGDPTTYRHDWGGPWLVGVLAVHCGPALLVLGYAARRLAGHGAGHPPRAQHGAER